MSTSTQDRCRVAVLISGRGSNLQALINKQQSGEIDIDIVCVISNRPDALGLNLAKHAKIKTVVIDHKDFSSRSDFDLNLATTILGVNADLIVLAGFMRILTPEFVKRFSGKLINIHPSLLPKYQGLNTHQRAIEAGDSSHGASVHFVTSELDGGPVIIQASIDINVNDNSISLAKKVQTQEHIIYPMAVEWFAKGRLQMKDKRVLLDGEPLPNSGFQVDSSNKN